MSVWVFAKAKFDESDPRYLGHYDRDDDPGRYPGLIYGSITSGRSRFGWSGNGNGNPNCASPVLLRIRPGDWIVHVNTPSHGHCIAVEVLHGVNSDEGLEVKWAWGQTRDFHHYFEIDTASIVEFDRHDAERFDHALYWQLCPRRRAQQVNPAVEASFFRFLEEARQRVQ